MIPTVRPNHFTTFCFVAPEDIGCIPRRPDKPITPDSTPEEIEEFARLTEEHEKAVQYTHTFVEGVNKALEQIMKQGQRVLNAQIMGKHSNVLLVFTEGPMSGGSRLLVPEVDIN